MQRPRAPRTITRFGISLAVALTALPVGTPASAAPRTPNFGPLIEDYAPYVGQTLCRPKPKPGVVAFRDLVLAEYPRTEDFAISRPCNIGGRSEHKEGRAWDWGVDATTRRGRRTARNLFHWLVDTDRHGNADALMRRLGIMYVVWNRRIWGTWTQSWETYCVQRRNRCRDPDSRAILNPHTDHMHFSFGWPGARMRTSFWNPELSRP